LAEAQNDIPLAPGPSAIPEGIQLVEMYSAPMVAATDQVVPWSCVLTGPAPAG
jgi:hypothetical protein